MKSIFLSYLFGYIVLLVMPLQADLSLLEGSDVDKDMLDSFIVESWETTPWEVLTEPGSPDSQSATKIVPGRPQAVGFNQANKNSMGLKFSFVFPGTSKVVLLPPVTKTIRKPLGQLDADNKPKYIDVRGIELPGKVEAISVWVLGRGNNYDLECWVRDWKGDVHILSFGSINFVGWRPMKVKIPHYVPQTVDSYPQNKTLVMTKLVLRSTPTTSQEAVIVFFDSLKVLSRVYDVYFDGADMHFDEQDKAEKSRMNNYYKKLRQNTK